MPAIRCDKNGTFYFNQPATELIGLKNGDSVEFILNPDRYSPNHLFVTKTLPAQGFPIKAYTAPGKKGVQFTSVRLRDKLMHAFNVTEGKSFLFTVHESELELAPHIKWQLKLEVHHG